MNSDKLLKNIESFEQQSINLLKIAKIRKLPNGKYRVLSEKGRNMGTYDTRGEAVKRLRAVEYFKHMDHNKVDDKKEIDLSDADEFSLSAIMRKLHEKGSTKQVRQFLNIYKHYFDKSVKNNTHNPDQVALQNTVISFNKIHPIKFNIETVKCAAVAELGNAEQVGKYLSDIVKFIINKLPLEKRNHATQVLKDKFSNLNETEISSKHLPDSAIYGQSITFVKHVLFNQDSNYVRDVLNSLARSL